MDDLTTLKGIGDSTAKALAGAGITTFAALAAIDPRNPPEIEGLRSPDWKAWAEAAALVAPAPTVTGEGEAGTGDAGKDPQPGPVPPASDPAADVMIIVTGPKRGRWRAGRHFGADPVEIPASDLTGAEFHALLDDPALTVVVDDPASLG